VIKLHLRKNLSRSSANADVQSAVAHLLVLNTLHSFVILQVWQQTVKFVMFLLTHYHSYHWLCCVLALII